MVILMTLVYLKKLNTKRIEKGKRLEAKHCVCVCVCVYVIVCVYEGVYLCHCIIIPTIWQYDTRIV
jgi:hypothetical protein